MVRREKSGIGISILHSSARTLGAFDGPGKSRVSPQRNRPLILVTRNCHSNCLRGNAVVSFLQAAQRQMEKAAKTVGGLEERTQPNKELSVQAGRALPRIDRAPDGDIKNNAGSTREIGAVFHPEGGIFFRNLSRQKRPASLCRSAAPHCDFFFRDCCPKVRYGFAAPASGISAGKPAARQAMTGSFASIRAADKRSPRRRTTYFGSSGRCVI
jgi:hypothetical protein